MPSGRRRATRACALVFALVTGGAIPDDAPWIVLADGSSVLVRPAGGSWSRWDDGGRRGLPLEIATAGSTTATLRTHADAHVWPRRHTSLVLDGRALSLRTGGVVARTGRGALEVRAAGQSVVVPSGRVRVLLDAGGGVLLLVEDGTVIVGGRSHRAGSALRWRAGRCPTLRPWPRGRFLLGASLEPARPPSPDLARVPVVQSVGASLAAVLFAERRFRSALLRICGEEPRRHRWLALAFLLETGTAVERAAAAGLATHGEAARLLHVLREARHDPDVRVRDAARAALARRRGVTPPRVREDLLEDPRVRHLVRDRAVRRARFEAGVVAHGLAALPVLPRWRTYGALDVLAVAIETVPDERVPSVVNVLEQVLGRTVDQGARARGDRLAARILLQTVGHAFQPPGEGLLLP